MQANQYNVVQTPRKVAHWLHFVLSIITFGLWIPVWIYCRHLHRHHERKVGKHPDRDHDGLSLSAPGQRDSSLARPDCTTTRSEFTNAPTDARLLPNAVRTVGAGTLVEQTALDIQRPGHRQSIFRSPGACSRTKPQKPTLKESRATHRTGSHPGTRGTRSLCLNHRCECSPTRDWPRPTRRPTPPGREMHRQPLRPELRQRQSPRTTTTIQPKPAVPYVEDGVIHYQYETSLGHDAISDVIDTTNCDDFWFDVNWFVTYTEILATPDAKMFADVMLIRAEQLGCDTYQLPEGW